MTPVHAETGRWVDADALVRVAFFIAAVVLAGAPLWAPTNTLRVLGEFWVYVALATLWNLLAGYAGLVSVGQQMFVGIGAYLMLSTGLFLEQPPLLALPLVGLAGLLISMPVAVLAFRLRGHYFAIGTWAIAEVFRLIVMQIEALGGGSGTSMPASMLRDLSSDRYSRGIIIYGASFVLAMVCLVSAFLFLRSKWGLALRSIRDSEAAAASVGINVQPIKFTLFCAIGGLTSMVGGVILLQKLRISPDAGFSVNDWTAVVIFIAVIGGVGTLEGPIIGTILFFLVREYLADLGPAYLILLGLLGVGVMIFAPQGLWGWVARRYALSPLNVQHLPPSHNQHKEPKHAHA